METSSLRVSNHSGVNWNLLNATNIKAQEKCQFTEFSEVFANNNRINANSPAPQQTK